MDDATPRLLEILKSKFGEERTNRLCALLQETGSLLAGGSILRAIHGETSSDFDIYVPVKHATAFLDIFVYDPVDPIIRGEYSASSYRSSMYCQSFLRKNGIKKVRHFQYDIARSIRVRIDVMIIRNNRTPLQVVNNFDLTFCQVWFDGQTVYASHPQDIRDKKGALQGEYVHVFLQGNTFLQERMKRYTLRGYQIALNTPVLSQTIWYTIANVCKIPSDDELMKHWFSRLFLAWNSNERDKIRHGEHPLTPSIEHANILVVPRTHFNRYITKNDTFTDTYLWKDTGRYDDGYDSEDITDNTMIYPFIQEEEKELVFYRKANKLLEIAMWPNTYTLLGGFSRFRTLGKLLEQELGNGKLEKYRDTLYNRCVRKGTSFITQEDDVPVFDIHEHPLEAGISAEDLEGYLGHHVTNADKTKVACYYRPNPMNPADPANCSHGITLSEVKYIVSKEFYDKYTSPVPTKMGLDQFMSHYDQTLGNVKDMTEGWGMLYHHTVCPFCVQFESRDSGCAYMTHENKDHLPSTATPYCDARLKIKELVDRYRALSDRGVAAHLEFCVECGRPCVDHSHISTTAPYTLIEAPIHNGHHDYAACTGGGRAELFARILAIRKVYRDGNIQDPMEERRVAALAADEAPNDPELMAKGAEIAANPTGWMNAPIPESKHYDDPAYQNTNSESELAPNENRNQEGGMRKTRGRPRWLRRTRKGRK
jgi:hypothetical protein